MTLLPHVDQIIVLDEGRVREKGTYRSLLEQNGAFADFLRNYLNEEAVDSDEGELSAYKMEAAIIYHLLCQMKYFRPSRKQFFSRRAVL